MSGSGPEAFVGQAGLVRRIFSRVGAERPQSVAVIGGRRSGKTALLAHLADESVRAQSLETPDRYLFLQPCASCSSVPDPDAFLKALLAPLPRAGAGAGNRYEVARAVIEGLHGEGRRVIVLLDDFHLVTGSERFPLEFFSFLRSMANNYNLAYVTTSILELQKLCVVKDVQESPFFNIFTNLHLGMLSPADAAALLAARAGVDPGDAARIVAWTGGSPWLILRAADALGRAGTGVPKDEAGIERLLRDDAFALYEEVVGLLPPGALRPLQAVAKGKQPDPAEAHHLVPLVKQGFLGDAGDGVSCATPGFAEFLRRGLAPRMLKGRE
jgi:hypothetical protein